MFVVFYSPFVCVCFLVYPCMASYVHTLYQNIPTSVPEHLRTRFARQSSGIGYYGVRINQATLVAEPLLVDETCELTMNVPGYIYMLKETVIVTRIKSWGFQSKIPLCAKIGSSFELQFTLQPGWDDYFRPIVFDADYGLLLNKFITLADGVLQANVTSNIVFEVQGNSIQMYVNGEEFFQPPEISTYPKTVQLYSTAITFHQTIFRSKPAQTP